MIVDLGLIDYEEAYRMQREFVRRRKLGEIEDTIILAEHNNIFTIGRTGKKENLLVSAKVLTVDRGGDITFHGPGQLVVYPIIDLTNRGRDLHKYLRGLEEVVIRFLSRYLIFAERRDGRTGVWVKGKKIASIGIAVSSWITFHGLSINVNCDLKFFSMINPCGMKDIGVTSMEQILDRCIGIHEVKEKVLLSFNDIFNLGEYEFANNHHAILA